MQEAVDWSEMPAAVIPTPRRPFVTAARTATMLSDLDRLRHAIRSHDTFATEAALEHCERWFDQLEVKSKYD